MSYVYPPDPDLAVPPTGDELPYEDGLPMESPRHRAQMEALISALDDHCRDRTDVFVGGKMLDRLSPPSASSSPRRRSRRCRAGEGAP